MKQIDDELIRGNIIAALAAAPDVHANSIRVYARDGHVRLEGTLDTLGEKEEAGRIAKEADGVRGLQNDLVVSADQSISDLELTLKAQERLDKAGLSYIGVRVAAGNAFVMGVVSSIATKEKAVETVESISGIRGVVSELEIALGKPTDDTTLTDNVVEAISENAQVEVIDLRATSDDGRVEIEGEVADEEQWKLVKSIAESVPGVQSVENHTRIQSRLPWMEQQ